MGVFDRTAERVATAAAGRHNPTSAYGRMQLQDGPLRGEESPQQMKRRAALLALMDRQKQQGHPSLTGASPAQQLLGQAELAGAKDAYASGQAATDLADTNERTRVRRNNGGVGVLANGWTADNSGEYARDMQAQVMAGNKAMTGTLAPRGYSGGNERPEDPRLTQQGRNQFGRIAQDAQAQQAALIAQSQQKAAHDTQMLAERRRIAREGDAWLSGQQANSQALHALGTRNARAY